MEVDKLANHEACSMQLCFISSIKCAQVSRWRQQCSTICFARYKVFGVVVLQITLRIMVKKLCSNSRKYWTSHFKLFLIFPFSRIFYIKTPHSKEEGYRLCSAIHWFCYEIGTALYWIILPPENQLQCIVVILSPACDCVTRYAIK